MNLSFKILIAFLIILSFIALIIAIFFPPKKEVLKESPGVLFWSKDGGLNWTDFMAETVKVPTRFIISKIVKAQGTIFILSTEGALLRSVDQGQSWEKAPVKNKVVDFSFYKENPAVIFYLTTTAKNLAAIRKFDYNSGNDVELYRPIVPSGPLAIFAIKSKEIVVFLSDGQILKSFDQGITWQSVAPLQEVAKSIFFNERFGAFFALTKSKFLRSNDGEKFQDLTDYLTNFSYSSSGLQWQAFWAQDDIYILANNTLFISQDGGFNFIEKKVALSKKNAPLMGLAQVNMAPGKRLILYSRNQIYLSDNLGSSWRLIQNPTKYPINLIVSSEDFKILFLAVIK